MSSSTSVSSRSSNSSLLVALSNTWTKKLSFTHWRSPTDCLQPAVSLSQEMSRWLEFPAAEGLVSSLSLQEASFGVGTQEGWVLSVWVSASARQLWWVDTIFVAKTRLLLDPSRGWSDPSSEAFLTNKHANRCTTSCLPFSGCPAHSTDGNKEAQGNEQEEKINYWTEIREHIILKQKDGCELDTCFFLPAEIKEV